jgi:repressor LexA
VEDAMALTRRQREVFDFISSFVSEKGYSPSLEEIAAQFGLSSVATVHKHVQHLVEKGLLRKAWNRSRSLEPVPEESEVENLATLPLVGTVAAGSPIEAIEDNETVTVPLEMAGRPGDSFVLRVR